MADLTPLPKKYHLASPGDVLLTCTGCGVAKSYGKRSIVVLQHQDKGTYKCTRCQARGKGFRGANARWGTPIPKGIT
jgi:hypothetical protein